MKNESSDKVLRALSDWHGHWHGKGVMERRLRCHPQRRVCIRANRGHGSVPLPTMLRPYEDRVACVATNLYFTARAFVIWAMAVSKLAR